MRHLIVGVLGLLIGVALASALLYYNPFTTAAAGTPSPNDHVLTYSLPDHVLDLAVGADATLPARAWAKDTLWEATIDRAAVLGLVLNDEAGPAAIATRLMAVSPKTDLLLHGVVISDYWLVTYPDRGTLFVRSDSNIWPFLKNTALPTWLLDRPWQGPVEYQPTVGPGADHLAVVVGVSGAFEGRSGSAVERYDITALDPTFRSAAVSGELFLHLPDTQIAQQ